MIAKLFLLALAGVALSSMARFDNEQVIRFTPTTQAQVDATYMLRNQSVRLGLDWWVEPSPIAGRQVDVRVPVAAAAEVSGFLAKAGIAPSVMIPNVQALVEEQMTAFFNKNKSQNVDFEFTQYNTLDDINEYIQSLPTTFPGLVTLFEVGTSYQGRTIYGVKVTGAGSNKPGFWLDGGIHAREWISPATVLWILNELTTGYGTNPEITAILDQLEVFVLPVFNVDGYVFTYNGNRLWRKTRRPNPGSTCIGTDPNRNFDDHWGEIGASPNPCDETFYGASPFSEVEVQAVADYIAANPNIAAYINVHSYSQLWLGPYGWTSAYPPDYNNQMGLMSQSVAALSAVFGTRYVYGPSYTTIYPTSGGSNDWTYGQLGIVHSYVIELRDTGQYGFLLPASQIEPSGIETFEGIKVAMQYVLDNPTKRRVVKAADKACPRGPHHA